MIKQINAVFTIPLYAPDNMNLTPLCDFTFECTQGGKIHLTKQSFKQGHFLTMIIKSYSFNSEKSYIFILCIKFTSNY